MDRNLLLAATAYAMTGLGTKSTAPATGWPHDVRYTRDGRFWKHKTASEYPDKIVGITLVDEDEAGEFTGIYLRDENDKLWPAMTVRRDIVDHHTSVCESWLLRQGIHQDKRSVK